MRHKSLSQHFLRFAAVIISLAMACSSRALTIVWTNTAGGNWNVAANWNPNQVPVAADTAVITNNGTYTVTNNTSASITSLTLGGASGTQSLVITNSGTLTLSSSSAVGANGALNLNGGALSGAGAITVNGPFNWTAGTINNTGGVTLNGTSSLTASAGQMSLAGGGLIINSGSLTWSGSGLNFTFGVGTLTNTSAGTITISTDVSTQNGGGVNTIGNAGLLRKTGGTGTTAFGNVALVNTGDVQVQSGTLNVGNGGSATGTFEVSANATLQFGGGIYNLNSASSITGAGSAVFSGGTVNASGTYNLTGTNTFSGATANFTNNYTITNLPVVISGGAANFNTGGNLNFASLSLGPGALGGNIPVPVNGPFNWTTGTINNTGGVTLNGTSSLTASAGQMALAGGGLIINAGSLTWSGSGLNFTLGSSTLTNLSTGTITIASDVSTQNGGGVNTIGNAGLLRKTGGTGTTTFGTVAFVNTGDVQVQSGTLNLGNGGSATGTFEVSANATLQFNSGIYNLSAASSVTGAGSAVFSGGTVNAGGTYNLTGTNNFTGATVNFTNNFTITNQSVTISAGAANFGTGGTLNFSSLSLSGGSLGGNLAVPVNGPFNWTTGTINNTGGVTLNGTSSLTASAGQMALAGGGLIINAGSLTWSGSGSDFTFGVATLTNTSAGTITIASDVSTQNGGGVNTIGNAGLLRKTGGTGTTAFGTVALVNSGDVQVQSGTLNLQAGGSASGTFEVPANSTLQFSGGTYTLSSASSITGAGLVLMSGATVNDSGNVVISGTNAISAGTFNLNSPAAVALSNLNMSAGILGGNAPVPVNGPFNWTGGTINNTGGVTLNGTSSLTASAGQMTLNGLLINAGPLTWSGSGLNFTFSSATLTNLATSTITITTDVSTQNGGGVNTIGNAGLIRKTGGTGTTAFGNVALVNTGDVQVQSGTLNLGAGGSATGTFEVPANSTLQFNGGTYTLNAASSITGAGNVLMSAGTVNESGNFVLGGTNTVSGTTLNVSTPATMAVSNLNFSAGILSGNALLPVNGQFNWAGGTINNTGGVKLNGTSSLTASTNQMTLNGGGLLINAGPLTWSGSNANFTFGTGSILTNLPSGTITIATDVSTQTGGGVNTIGNAGLIRKTGGGGTTTFTAVGLVNTGTLDVQSGTINLAAGHNLTNGTLNFGISNLTTFGTISLSGAASLAGTVSANLINGYQPIMGNSFAVLTYGSRSNIFTNAVLPSADAWQTNYAATVFSLTVLNARPSLAPITTQTVKELTTLTVTNIATDPDIPAQGLIFALPVHPSGMIIDTNSGILTWTPDQTQSPSTNAVTVTVTDSGTPPLTATNSYNVIVQEVNQPPTLPNIPTQIVNELTLLTVTNTATESNIHSTNAGYALISPPNGMSIDANGIITWTPDQTQSPSTNLITTVATNGNPYDLINPMLTSTNTFSVIVKEVNVVPVLPVIPPHTINELSTLTVTNAATDSNIHAVVSYGLVSPPTGAAIDASGVITWTPGTNQCPSTNTITTVATATDAFDLINPVLTATNSFTVFVVQPVLSIQLVQTNSAVISWSSPATGFVLQQNSALSTTNWVNNAGPTNVVNGQNQVTVSPPAGTNFYRLLHP